MQVRQGQIRVLVVDDQPALRDLMLHVVARVVGMTVVGEARSGEAALDAAQRLTPDLVIMDVQMPGMGGVEAARRLTDRRPGTVVLLVSASRPKPDVAGACGAAAFLSKGSLSPRALREFWLGAGVTARRDPTSSA